MSSFHFTIYHFIAWCSLSYFHSFPSLESVSRKCWNSLMWRFILLSFVIVMYALSENVYIFVICCLIKLKSNWSKNLEKWSGIFRPNDSFLRDNMINMSHHTAMYMHWILNTVYSDFRHIQYTLIDFSWQKSVST